MATSNQTFSSAGTSLRQVPALFKWWQRRHGFHGLNLDLGGGRFDEVQAWMADNEVPCENLVYDPYNRPEPYNMEVVARVETYRGADSVTIANVLNVIDSDVARGLVLEMARLRCKPGGHVLVSIHEGDGSGVGRETKRGCWQANRRAGDYLGEIERVLGAGKPVMRSGNAMAFRMPRPLGGS